MTRRGSRAYRVTSPSGSAECLVRPGRRAKLIARMIAAEAARVDRGARYDVRVGYGAPPQWDDEPVVTYIADQQGRVFGTPRRRPPRKAV